MSTTLSATLSSETTVRLVSSWCKRNGKTLGKALEEGHAIPQMVHDELAGSLQRLKERDQLPEELILEAEAWAEKNTPIPAGK